jgi:uncharacterized protein (DUF4415 family)
MKKNSNKRMRTETDWSQFDAQTDEQIVAAVARDPDVAPIVDREWFASARVITPGPKEQISIRLDRDILDHLRSHPRYQTQINEILRAFVEHDKRNGKGEMVLGRSYHTVTVRSYSGQPMASAKQIGLGRRRSKNSGEAAEPPSKPPRAARRR